MSYLELFLLSVGLCFDTFAISLSGGICLKEKPTLMQRVKIVSAFALFQAGFAFFGWGLGASFANYIEPFDHWVAFILLGYIGGRMIYGSLKPDRCDEKETSLNLTNNKSLVFISIATSIDALAVGISLAMIHLSSLKVGVSMSMILLLSALASLLGLLSGKRLSGKAGQRSELIGGVVLVLIGLKILIEHLVS